MKNLVKHQLVKFTMVGNVCLRNKDISNSAKGLYAILWDLPDDWELTYHGLAAKCKDGVSAIKTQMHELLAAGYVVVEQKRGEDGRMGMNVWNILCVPAPVEDRTPVKTRKKRENAAKEGTAHEGNKEPLTEKPLTEKPLTDFPLTENRTQDNKENKIIREEGNRQAVSVKKQNKAEFSELEERRIMWFCNKWNSTLYHDADSKTARITTITEKRKHLILAILKQYTHDGVICDKLIERGINNAMKNKRAQGLIYGASSPADINYMLENFIKLVEGTF